ncbi:hypothetical protein Fmac_001894 [Flemingia macrophylla]|uniref:Uncharacterized protein n=1 Tax=Flemingia macrophylla TaxID=520843 RepID=A0ABD1NIF4_9FABA
MMLTCLATAEVLKKETEEANEEQVLVKLARIKALKELAYIEAQIELKTVKEMEKRVQGDWSVKQLEGSFSKGEQ